MIKGDSWDDIIGQQLVDEVVVVVDTRLVLLPNPAGQDSGPSDGEPVAVEAHSFQELHILLVLVVGVAGHISAGSVLDIARNLQHHCQPLPCPRNALPW